MTLDTALLKKTFINTVGAVVYIFIVSQIMQNGDKIFGKNDDMLGFLVVLLLFSLSAAVVSGLVFGLSLKLFIENKKSECIQAAIYSVGWLGLYTVIGIMVLILT